MPDDWELAKSLDINNPEDRNSFSTTGYTYLEDYLNELVKTVTSVEENEIKIAGDYKLLQNYPNPFNPSTKIIYNLQKSDFTILEIYSPLGQKIEVLTNEFQNAGIHEVNWNVANGGLGSLHSGVYLARLKSGSKIQTIKLLLLK